MLLGGGAEAFQVRVLERQAVGAQLRRCLGVVLEPQHHKAPLGVHRHLYQPLFRVRLGPGGGNGVVQGHPHDGAQLPDGQKTQHPAIGHAGDVDVLLLALHGLGSQNGIQHRVAGLILRLVLADVFLNGLQGSVLLGLVLFLPDNGQLELQLMVPPIDELDPLLAALVLLVLPMQHLIHGGQLVVEGVFSQLLMLHCQHQHPGKIHQGADGKDAHVDLAARQKAQIAHRKGGQRQHHRCQGRTAADLQMLCRLGEFVLEPTEDPEHHPIHHPQQHQGQGVDRAPAGPEVAVELPLDAGGKLCHDKGPGTVIPGLQQGDAPGAPQI